MRRINIVLPQLVGHPDGESALRSLPEAFAHVVARSEIVRVAPLQPSELPEAAFLGLDPQTVQVAQGPLTVAALGHTPPQSSIQFHLTLGSVNEDGVMKPLDPKDVSPSEVGAVFQEVKRLGTRTLTPVEGEVTDHALVLEGGSLELQTTPFLDAQSAPVHEFLPVGESERSLRQFIDDSINLLDALELNHVRREEGKSPINVLWPWGQGVRPNMPSLPLRRGDVAFVESGLMRLQGLCRLVGYEHGDRARFVHGLKTNYAQFSQTALSRRISLCHVGTIEPMQRHHRTEEVVRELDEVSRAVLEPLLHSSISDPIELRVCAPGGATSLDTPPDAASPIGLGLLYRSDRPQESQLPWDERILDDKRVPTVQVWEHLYPGFLGDEG